MTKNKTTSFSLPPAITDRIQDRLSRGQSKSARLWQDLADYYALLDLGLKMAKRKLQRNQAKAILDVLNKPLLTPGDMAMWAGGRIPGLEGFHYPLVQELADGCDMDGLHIKWSLDRDKLLQTVNDLSPLEHVALLDWVSRMWNHHKDDDFWEKEISQFQDQQE